MTSGFLFCSSIHCSFGLSVVVLCFFYSLSFLMSYSSCYACVSIIDPNCVCCAMIMKVIFFFLFLILDKNTGI